MAYFERVGEHAFRATGHVGGAWNPDAQHIAPALGLLTHAVEADRDRRRADHLMLARLSFDILGAVPVDVVEIGVKVIRPGRTIELVEATLSHAGRAAVLLRAWLLQPRDTTGHALALPAIAPPEDMPAWDPTTVWPGGFIASAEVRRHQVEPGRAAFWVRTSIPLIDDTAVSRLAGAAGLFDIANGMTVRVHPREVAFPNVDLTATCSPSRGASGSGSTPPSPSAPAGSASPAASCMTSMGRSARWPKPSPSVLAEPDCSARPTRLARPSAWPVRRQVSATFVWI